MPSDKDFFQSICKVSRAFGTTLEKAKLLDLIVESAIEAMDGKAACLFLADEERDVFVPAAQKGLSDSYLHARPERARVLVEELIEKGFLAIRDAARDERSENHAAKKAEGIVSILVVPVIVNNKVVGVLTLYASTERDFSSQEVDFLRALAEQGGIAVERARLIGQIRNNARLFHDLSVGINASLDMKETMVTLTTGLAKALNAKGVSVSLVDEGSGALKPVSSHGLSADYLEREPMDEAPLVKSVLEGETVFVKNVLSDKRIPEPAAEKAEGIVTLLGVPIVAKDEVIGALRLYYGAERDFYEDEILTIKALAYQAGAAIQNAVCYLALENDMNELKDDIWSHRSWF